MNATGTSVLDEMIAMNGSVLEEPSDAWYDEQAARAQAASELDSPAFAFSGTSYESI